MSKSEPDKMEPVDPEVLAKVMQPAKPATVNHFTHDHMEVIVSAEQHEALKQLLEAQKAGRPKSFREHVKECDKCVVTDDGSVWACKEGSAIRQRERKVRL